MLMRGGGGGVAISQSNGHLIAAGQPYEKMRRGGRQEQVEEEPASSSLISLSLSEEEEEQRELRIQSGEDDGFDVELIQLKEGTKGKRKRARQQETMTRQEWNPCIDQVEQTPNKVEKLFEQIRNKKKPKDKPISVYASTKKKRLSAKQQRIDTQKDTQQQLQHALSQKQLLRIISHHIQGILRTRKKLKMEDLIQELCLQVPQKIKDRLTTQIVSEALQLARNPLGKYAQSGKRKTKVCSETGVIKNELDVQQYCKIVLDLLDTCKIVYFVSVEKLVETKNNKLQYTSELDSWERVEAEVARNVMYFRGVLGSNLQSFCDILSTSDTLESRNNSFSFLLKVLARNSGPTQKYLFMTKPFMDQYGPSLRLASESGFIFCELAASLKAFNPLCYWLRDLKLLASKHSVHNPQQLRQILQYEACRFDKQVYSDYFRMVRRKMRKLVTSSGEGGWSAQRQ